MTHAQYIQYFEDIASGHYLLLHGLSGRKSFFRIDIDEMLEGLSGKSIAFPCMLLESFTGSGDGGQGTFFDNPLDKKTCAFSILYKAKQNEYDDQNTKLDLALKIGKEVISRILHDFKTKARWQDGNLKVSLFYPSSVTYQKVGPLTDNEYGYRFQFDLIFAEKIDLSWDPEKWLDTATPVTFTLDAEYCLDAAASLLTPSVPGGVFTGPGVIPFNTDYYFDPGEAGVGGPYEILYTLDGHTPAAQSTMVNDLPTVTLDPFADVMINVTPFELTGGLPAGGYYVGDGVEDDFFDPSVAGLGQHSIYYVYTDGKSCGSSAQQQITVIPVVEVPGCTDINANNYNPAANVNNGSCTYDPPPNLRNYEDVLFGTETSDYTVVNVQYIPGRYMNIWYPVGDTKTDRACIFILHAGGANYTAWQVEFWAKFWLSLGYVPITLDYGPSTHYTAGKQKKNATNVGAAVRYAKEYATTLGINPNKIIGHGFSAGANTILQFAMAANNLTNAYFPTTNNQYFPNQTNTILATATMPGASSPIFNAFIDPADPPNYYFHGDQDTTQGVSYANAQTSYAAQIAAGIASLFKTFAGAGHNLGHDDEIKALLVPWFASFVAD